MFFGYSHDHRALVFLDPASGQPLMITARDLRRAPFPPKQEIVNGEEVIRIQPDGWKASDADLERALPAVDKPRIVMPGR